MFTYAFLHNVLMNWEKEMYLINLWEKSSFEGAEFLGGRELLLCVTVNVMLRMLMMKVGEKSLCLLSLSS